MGDELQRALVEKVLADTRGTIEPKIARWSRPWASGWA
jgi:hypothetical protein